MTTDNDVPKLLERKFERVSLRVTRLRIGAWKIYVHRADGSYYAQAVLCCVVMDGSGPYKTEQAAADAAWAWIVAQVEPIAKMVAEARKR